MHLTFILLKSPNLKILGYPVLHNSVNKLDLFYSVARIACRVWKTKYDIGLKQIFSMTHILCVCVCVCVFVSMYVLEEDVRGKECHDVIMKNLLIII